MRKCKIKDIKLFFWLDLLKRFIEYSNDIDDIHKNIEEYNPNKKRKILIAFDEMVTDILSKKNLIQ